MAVVFVESEISGRSAAGKEFVVMARREFHDGDAVEWLGGKSAIGAGENVVWCVLLFGVDDSVVDMCVVEK